jgi:membrane dipeptidase
MILLDAHQDIAYNHLKYGRDYRRSALITRRAEPADRDHATLGLPEAIAGRVAVVCATLFVAPPESGWVPVGRERTYNTPLEAYSAALEQLDYYERITDESPDKLRLIRTQADLDAVLATWADGVDIRKRQQGLIVLMEGADPIIEPRQFEEWHGRGVRVVGTAWEATRYSGGTGYPGGLTKLGFELLDVMASFKAVLDLSHMAEQAALESLDRYEGPIIASHSNPRKFRDTDRHLPDLTIRRLAERDGVMGVVLFNRFLDEHWARGSRKEAVTMQRVIEIIDHVCQLTGSAQHIGLGTDWDGGFGAQHIPAEFDTIADLYKVTEALRERGFSEPDIDAIASGNMLRVLRRSLS